jgi:hypothetical protein
MTITAKIADHPDAARTLTLGRFWDKPRLQELVRILGDQVQLLEDVLWQIFEDGLLINAEGVVLDEYGDILDEPRCALGDDDYRRVLQVAVGAHQSDGTAPQTIYLFALLVDATVRYTQQGRATCELSYDTSNPATDPDWRARVQRIAEILRPVGVTLTVVEGNIDAGGNPFQLDTDGQGLDQGELCDRIV